MNKPIRTISIFCLLLFLALMVNATYLQYYKAGALDEDPRNRRVSRRRSPASAARSWSAARRSPRARSPTTSTSSSGSYPQPFQYAPLTGWFSYFSQTGLEQSQNDVLSGDDSRLFVTRLVDLLSNSTPKGGSVQLTIDPDGAGGGVRRACAGSAQDVQGAVVAIEPSTGKILAMVSLPTYDPNQLATHDFSRRRRRAPRSSTEDETQPLLNRAIQTRLPPGSTFKLVTAAAAIEERQLHRRLAGARRRDVPAAADHRAERPDRQRGPRAAAPTGSRSPRRWSNSCNTTFATLAVKVGADAMRETGRGVRLQQPLPRRPRPARPSRTSPRTSTSRRPRSPASASSRCPATPLQMAMVAAGIANGGTVMKPYLVDEIQSPELDVARQDRARGAVRQAVSARRRASELTEMMVCDRRATAPASPAAIPGVEVAGKTGTAQSGSTTSRRTPGSCRSPRPTTRRSRSRSWSRTRRRRRAARSPAAGWPARSPRRSWRR